MSKCRDCRWYAPGSAWPHYDRRGDCMRITPASAGERPAEIHPHASNACLNVASNFGCNLHEKEGKP